MGLQQAAPVLLVEDVITTAEHYRDALGFTFDRFWGDPPQMALMDRDSVRIALMQAPAAVLPKVPTGFADVFVYVGSVDATAEDMRARGAKIVAEPAEATVFDGRTFAIMDCNRRVISFVEMRGP